MILVVGLGNPGKQYSNTRHNIGFIVINYLVNRYNLSLEYKSKFNSLVAIDNINTALSNHIKTTPHIINSTSCTNNYKFDSVKNHNINEDDKHKKVILAQPQTFMNLSGEAVRAIMNYYKTHINNLIVIHDDVDLPLGKIKFKLGGGSAGHNGLKSIDQNLSNNYYRIRIGVGKSSEIELSNYVLGEFSKNELITLNKSIEKILDNMILFYKGDIEQFKNAISQ